MRVLLRALAAMNDGSSRRFALEGCIAESRMAEVHRVFDRQLGRVVALKRPRRDRRGEPLIEALFRHEQRLAATLDHPHIPRTFEVGSLGGTPYILFELVEGERLVDLLTRAGRARRFLPLDRVRALGRGLAAALAHLHRPSITPSFPGAVHMDVCPHNVLIRPNGEALLIDFGISRSAWLAEGVPLVLGRDGYLAPELFRSAQPSPALDVFAVGVLLHEALLARPLFRAGQRAETFRRIQQAPIPVPHLCRPSCPPALGEVVLRALARDPAQRFKDGSELAAAFSKAL